MGLLLCATACPQSAWAYEPRPALYPAATVTLYRSGRDDTLWYEVSSTDISRDVFTGRTGAMIEVPVFIVCDTVQEVFRTWHPAEQDWEDGDTTHTEEVVISVDPKNRQVVMTVSAQPLVEKNRRVRIHYSYLLLDELPEGLCGPSVAVEQMLMRLFFNEYNLYVSIARVGAPFQPVYSSPVNIGIGPTLMHNLTTASPHLRMRGSMPVPFWLELSYWYRVRIYALYWRFLKDVPESSSNLIDDINLNYGSMALPVRAPFLDAASSAPGVLASFIN